MVTKHYIDKNGNKKTYKYDKTYPHKNLAIYRLQKSKYYYKKKGDFEKVRTCEILIGIEKRKEKLKEV